MCLGGGYTCGSSCCGTGLVSWSERFTTFGILQTGFCGLGGGEGWTWDPRFFFRYLLRGMSFSFSSPDTPPPPSFNGPGMGVETVL